MFVVRVETEESHRFRAFRKRRDALSYARLQDQEIALAATFEISDTDDAEIAVMAVRDGLGVPLIDREPDAAVMLASMGLGTGLRI